MVSIRSTHSLIHNFVLCRGKTIWAYHLFWQNEMRMCPLPMCNAITCMKHHYDFFFLIKLCYFLIFTYFRAWGHVRFVCADPLPYVSSLCGRKGSIAIILDILVVQPFDIQILNEERIFSKNLIQDVFLPIFSFFNTVWPTKQEFTYDCRENPDFFGNSPCNFCQFHGLINKIWTRDVFSFKISGNSFQVTKQQKIGFLAF